MGGASILAPCALQTSLALSAAIPYSRLPRRLFKLYVKTIDYRAGQKTGEMVTYGLAGYSDQNVGLRCLSGDMRDMRDKCAGQCEQRRLGGERGDIVTDHIE